MKSKILMIIIGVVVLTSVVQTKAFGQNPSNDKAFDSVRTEIIKKACTTFNYQNKEVLKIIENNTGYSDALRFHRELKKDTTNKSARPLAEMLGNMPKFGNDLDNNYQLAIRYLNQVVARCQKKDTSWAVGIRDAIIKISTSGQRTFSDETAYSGAKTKETKKNTNEKCLKCGIDKSECMCNKDKKSPVVPIIFCIAALLGIGYFFYRKKKNSFRKLNEKSSSKEVLPCPQPSSAHNEKTIVAGESGAKEKPNPKSPDSPKEPESNDSRMKESETIHQTSFTNEWILVGTSVKGNGHIQSNMPCQDNHKFESLGDGWGVAIVSDGAGSAAHSELGSKVVAERGVLHFKNLIEKEGWMKNNVLPTDIEWLQKSYYTLKTIRDEVELIAQKNNIELKSLSATCLVVIYSPIGLLAVHVGDGRMGYKSASGEWRAMMTPHKGEEANQTIFLVSDFWSIPNYVMSGVLVPESIVVREPVKAFALMSDGCENTSWRCTTLNPETGKYYDQNKPFEGFFNPLEETLISFQAANVSEEERQAKWSKFIESGTTGFVKEQDDKTMIYGYCCGSDEIEACIDRMRNMPRP